MTLTGNRTYVGFGFGAIQAGLFLYEAFQSGNFGRLVVAEEQWHDAGWGATLISRLTMAGASMAAAPRAVSLMDDVLIPYAPPLEDQMLPSAERIAEEVRASLMS